jgi:hypothetical protein
VSRRTLRPVERPAMGMAWYTPESYERMRAVAEDEGGFDLSYPEFVAKVERLAQEFERQGYRVEKTLISVDACVRWCRANGHRVDQKGRAAFCASMRALAGADPAFEEAP